MKKAKLLSTLTLLLLLLTATAQEKNSPKIELKGHAKIEVVPDILTIKFELHELVQKKKKISIKDLQDSMLLRLNKNNISTEQISITHIHTSRLTVGWFRSYILEKRSYELKCSSTDETIRVIEVLDSLNISRVTITDMSYSKMDSIKREVRVMAIKNGKEKIAYLLNAIDLEMDEITYISEDKPSLRVRHSRLPTRSLNAIASTSSAVYLEKDRSSEIKSILFKKMVIEAEVFIQCSMKEADANE